ncbi:MAG: flagellin [Bryobacteraceae bacterium]
MTRGIDAHTDKFLSDIADIRTRIDRAQREIASGHRVNSASDSPDEIGHLLSVRSNLSAMEQTQQNLGRVDTETRTAENALSGAIDIVERVAVLGTQGGSDITSADARKTLANEVDQLLGNLVNTANTQLEGRFIFSGDSDLTAPYAYDPTQANPVGSYQGATSSRQVQHPSGPRFSISKTADEIFDNTDPQKNVFAAVRGLRDALIGNDGATIRTAVGSVQASLLHLNNQLAFYGGVQNQVQSASDFASKQTIELKKQISQIEDADLTSSILELNNSKFQLETALQAESQRPRTSLFNYLR